MAKNKQLNFQEICEQANNLTTKEQKDLRDFLNKTLDEKAAAAQEELQVINGDKNHV